MAFEITADPSRFDEASGYFLGRAVITREEARRLTSDAKTRAFWIGAGLQLAQVQRVFDEVAKALDSGEPFDDWRKRVRTELTNDAHAETVFRNATQRSYNAGRYRQMREVEAWRPYWMFDAILDSRTTRVCRKCNGTILPASDPWWLTHQCPLHHSCRSSTRSLRTSEAEERGITRSKPSETAADGFGLAPELDPIWKPDPTKGRTEGPA